MLLKQKNCKSGFFLRHVTEAPASRTIVVLGAPRGGTSLVAGALRLAGVFMGDDIDQANNEDRAFNLHGGNLSIITQNEGRSRFLDHVRRTIAQRNATRAVWGWKDPLAALYISDILPDLVNPRLILVTRDPTAAVMRERIEAAAALEDSEEAALYVNKAQQALLLYQTALSVIETSCAPTFFVSYEKASRHGKEFAVRLLDFIGGPHLPADKRKAAVEAIGLYAREGAVSADLAHRPTPTGTGPVSGIELSSFADLSAVYERCATLINLKHYEAGLVLARSVLAQLETGFKDYPQLRTNAILRSEVEAGMCFMAAIAMVNLGDGTGSYLALGRFAVVAGFFELRGQRSKLIDGIAKEAADLHRRLEQDLRR
jgi:hypothetical protein